MLGKEHATFYWCYTPNSGDTGGILDDSRGCAPTRWRCCGSRGHQRHQRGIDRAVVNAYTVSQSAGSVSLSVNPAAARGAV